MEREKIAILVDSCTDVPAEERARLGIYVAPMTIHYKEGSYTDGVDITPGEVYDRFPAEIPSTSLPSSYAVLGVLRQIQQDGYEKVLLISISSGLSGTNNVFHLAVQNVPELECRIFDTRRIGIGAGLLVLAAARLIESGVPFEDLVPRLEQCRGRGQMYFCLSTLDYLRKGGRIGLVSGAMGSLLGVLPVISCNDEGVYYTVKKARGRKNCLKAAMDQLVKDAAQWPSYCLAVVHGGAAEEAAEVLAQLKARLPHVRHIYTGQISPALVVHTGPGLIGICAQAM